MRRIDTMPKYIDADALIDELGDEPLNWTHSDAEIQEASDYRCFKELIESMPAIDVVEREKWTSVEDSLPKEKGEYLVIYHPCYWDHVRDEIKVGLDSFRGKITWAKAKYQRVTHWMPKPRLPNDKIEAKFEESYISSSGVYTEPLREWSVDRKKEDL
jgi:hypothetical protein